MALGRPTPPQGVRQLSLCTEKGTEAQGGDTPGQAISWMGAAGRCLLLAGRSWLGKFPGTCHPHPGLTSLHTPAAPSLWVGHQPDLLVVPDLCLSVSQAGTPTTRQVLSASGTAPQGQLLWVGRRLPESSGTWGRRQVCLDPAPCSSSSASFPDA